MVTSYSRISFISLVALAATAFSGVQAESHTVSFNNRCKTGTPTLRAQSGQTLSTGPPFTSNGPLIGAIAYLQTGGCGANGENCLTVETTLKNPDPSQPGSGSSTDLTLIPPHEFSVTTGFAYANGCDGQGHTCSSESCTTAFHVPTDTGVQVACQTNNVNLVVTFC